MKILNKDQTFSHNRCGKEVEAWAHNSKAENVKNLELKNHFF